MQAVGYRYYGLLPLHFQAWVPVPHDDAACWRWTGRHHRGSGRALCMHKGMRHKQAADWSWELHFGPVRIGYKVMPKCRNKSCVNPNHLIAVPRR